MHDIIEIYFGADIRVKNNDLRTDRYCKESGILSNPDDCFKYLGELPDKYPQITLFDT